MIRVHIVSKQVKRAIPLVILALLSGTVIYRALLKFAPRASRILYQGRPMDAWFYGSKTNFFAESTRRAAQEALEGIGTNAFPFLLSKLDQKQGNSALYFKIYPVLPAQVRSKLPYPISGDDIKALTLDHIRQTRRLSKDQVQTLADRVVRLRNPRLRMMGFRIILMKFQTDPAFLKLCRRLLHETHPGIRLEAAISLAESAIASDPGEPALAGILLSALESKEMRAPDLDLVWYRYGQQPPGGSGRFALPPTPPGFPRPPDPDDALRSMIITALDRLEPYLSQSQKDRFKKAAPNFPFTIGH